MSNINSRIDKGIDVGRVLSNLPNFSRFPSVAELYDCIARFSESGRGTVAVAGMSREGRPIHHLRCGTGRLKALIVGGPHCPEPIGSLTVSALIAMLGSGDAALLEADIEWHVVPCIDPDGALLNEGWSQFPFTLKNYMHNYHLQAPADQVDTSFPISHPSITLDNPSTEARILKELLSEIRPDFYFSLHNAWTGGAFYFSSWDIGARARAEIKAMLEQVEFPIQQRPIWREICASFDEGFVEIFSMKKYYDHLHSIGQAIESLPRFAAGSWDYLAEIKPSALTFVAEMGYVRHPSDESEIPSGHHFRDLRLALDARCKALAHQILDVWNRLESKLDRDSPFFRAMIGGMVCPTAAGIAAGGPPISRYPTAEIYADPRGNTEMTEGDLFTACIVDGGFHYLPIAYQFVRLLKETSHLAEVQAAIESLQITFDQILDELGKRVDFSAFEPIDYNTLLHVQLGSGLIALNAALELLENKEKVALSGSN